MNNPNTARHYLVTGGDGKMRQGLRRALERRSMQCTPSRDPPGFTVEVPGEQDDFFRRQVAECRGDTRLSPQDLRTAFSEGMLRYTEVQRSQSFALTAGVLDVPPTSSSHGKVVFSLGSRPPAVVQEEVEPAVQEDLTLDQLVKAARRRGISYILAAFTLREFIQTFKEKQSKNRLLEGYQGAKLIAVARAKGGGQILLQSLKLQRLLEAVVRQGGRERLLEQIFVSDIIKAAENALQRVGDRSPQSDEAHDTHIATDQTSAPIPASSRRRRTRTMSPSVLLGGDEEFVLGDELATEELIAMIKRGGALEFLSKLTFGELMRALRQKSDRDRVFDEFMAQELIELIQERGGEQEFLSKLDLLEVLRVFLSRGGVGYFLGQLKPMEILAIAESKLAQLKVERAELANRKDEEEFRVLEGIEARYASLQVLQGEQQEFLRSIKNLVSGGG